MLASQVWRTWTPCAPGRRRRSAAAGVGARRGVDSPAARCRAGRRLRRLHHAVARSPLNRTCPASGPRPPPPAAARCSAPGDPPRTDRPASTQPNSHLSDPRQACQHSGSPTRRRVASPRTASSWTSARTCRQVRRRECPPWGRTACSAPTSGTTPARAREDARAWSRASSCDAASRARTGCRVRR